MSTNIITRIHALERRMGGGTCQTCFGWPTRLCEVDEETHAELSENMPADGCPACGRPIRSTIRIVGVDPTQV